MRSTIATIAVVALLAAGVTAFTTSHSHSGVTHGDTSAAFEAERSEVADAVMDYVEAIYDVEPDRIERSVSKDLVKYGFWRASADEEYRASPMTYEQLHRLAATWNVDNQRNIDSNSPKEILVLDVLDKTAAAKLTAYWGIDYFQLEKVDGKWMIRHILWQSHPESS